MCYIRNWSIRLSAGSVAVMILMLAACQIFQPVPPGIGKAVDWQAVSGWEQDRHAEAWPALQQNCLRLPAKQPAWRAVCDAALLSETPNDEQAQVFFQRHFTPHLIHGAKGKREGLITGYYEPLLHGSWQPTERFAYPIYGRPENLLKIDLGELYPELKGKRIRGRLEGNRVVPFYSRREIENSPVLAGEEVLWVDDRDGLFFLHIQGSGRVRLPDGGIVGVGYADQNGHPYVAIGRRLIEMGELEREAVSMQSIRAWLRDNPTRSQQLLEENPSYIFFVLRDSPGEGPIGSLNVPLTPERSVAIDPEVVPLGTPLWLVTALPGEASNSYRRLVFSQDTGGAIKGPVRVDLFFGQGARAEELAGEMKQSGQLFALLPKS